MTALEVKRLIDKIRNPFFTGTRKTALKDLADDLLSEFSSPDDLKEKFELFIVISNKLTI